MKNAFVGVANTF